MVSTGKPTEALIAASPKPAVPGHVVMPPSAAHKALVQPRRRGVDGVDGQADGGADRGIAQADRAG